MEKKTRKKSELLTVIVVLVVTISVVIVGYAIYIRIVNEVQYNQSKIRTEQENKEQNNNSEILYKLSDNKYINKYGYIIHNSNISDVTILEGITIKDNQERLDENSLSLLSELIKLRETLENIDLLEKVNKIDVRDIENIKLSINSENKTVELGNFENLTSKSLYIKNIMEQEKNKKGTISVKDVNKVYFRESI